LGDLALHAFFGNRPKGFVGVDTTTVAFRENTQGFDLAPLSASYLLKSLPGDKQQAHELRDRIAQQSGGFP